MVLEEDRLVHETRRQMGQALVASYLVATKLKNWRGSTGQKAHEIAKLHKGMESLQEELKQSNLLRQDVEALLTEKAKETMSLTEEREKHLAKVEKLKGELAQKDEDLAKEKESFKNDVAQSYLVGFEEAVEQASGLLPEIDFSVLGPSKTVVDIQLKDEQFYLSLICNSCIFLGKKTM